MKVSLIVSTYNYPQALRLSLQSVLSQTRMPDEVLVADDGSGPETRRLVEEMREGFPVPLRHVWHEDKGFRLAAIRNKAIREAAGDYIIQIDGDIVMERHFIADHLAFAQEGFFCSGSRAMVSEGRTKRAFEEGRFVPSPFGRGIQHRLNALRCGLLTPFFHGHARVNGCNLAFWRKDLYAVNGYDEAIVGWGCEDHDLTDRLKRYGLRQRHIKFRAIQYHLWHRTAAKDALQQHKALLEERRSKGLVRCGNGLC